MTERENLCKGLSYAAWGYFFLNFDLHLGTVSILPQFAGYILLCLAVEKLAGERRDLLLLRPLCILLAVWSGGDWLLSWGGGDIDGHVLFLDLLVAAAELYFQYQFLTDIAALAEVCQPEGRNWDSKLRRRRTAYIVLVTAFSLFTSLTDAWLGADWRTAGTLVLMAVSMVISLMIMSALFHLRKSVRKENAGV